MCAIDVVDIKMETCKYGVIYMDSMDDGDDDDGVVTDVYIVECLFCLLRTLEWIVMKQPNAAQTKKKTKTKLKSNNCRPPVRPNL